MRTVPHELNRKLNSSAEEKVFQAFKQLKFPEPAYVIHSLNLTKTERKRAGEIDFLLVANDCLLVLEVKGGRVRRTEHGSWEFKNRHDQVSEKWESPFQQASEAMYALIRRLKDQGFTRADDFVFGYGVVFPDIEFRVESVEWDLQTVLDARAFETPSTFEQAIKRLIRYWKVKANKKLAIAPPAYKNLMTQLRPSFELVPTLATQAQELDQALSSLTESQYRFIDAASANKRVLCSGGAGTGKTFMLLENARRSAALGEQVLITCESEPLANHMRQQIGLDPLIKIKPYSQLGKVTEPVDILLVDEGQDILDFEGLGVLDKVVKGGLERGKWRVFYDPNYQAAIRGRFDEAAETYLKELATIIHLNQNCRNTREVAEQTLLLTGASIGEPIVSRSMKVEFLYHDNDHDQLQNLLSILGRLDANDIPRSDVAILSMCEAVKAVSLQLPIERSRGTRSINEAMTKPATRSTGYTLGLIEDYKGLESRFLILTDIDGDFAEKRVNELLYVGMTRARVGLYILFPKQRRKSITRLVLQNGLENML